jgi:hypothetical protein
MISTDRTRVKIKEVVSSQLPSFVRDNYPLISEFLNEYYSSQEYTGSPLDLLQNIDQYFDLDSLLNHSKTCVLAEDVTSFDTTIPVLYNPSQNFLGTYGFPEKYGLIKINNEIILYKSKTERSFEECVRGFSGISEYGSGNDPEQLIFSSTVAEAHNSISSIDNLSALFLDNFLLKLKNQFLPGFEGRELSPKVNQKVLIGRISDFYESKGNEDSIKILFSTLYGEPVKIINPKDFILKPSSSNFLRSKDVIVESIEGDPLRLKNRTLVQDAIPSYGVKYAEAFVNDVEIIRTDDKNYYRMKLDYDYDRKNNTTGNYTSPFISHPHTKLTSAVSSGSTVFDVDSTIGFPTSGNLIFSLENGLSEEVSYDSKSLTQFFGKTPIESSVSIGSTVRLDVNAYGYPGISTSDVIKVRIGSVFKNINLIDNGFYFSENDTARVIQPGIASSSFKANDWILNIPVKYNISEIFLIDSANLVYRVKTYDNNIFYVGDTAILEDDTSEKSNCIISSIIDSKTFTIKGQGILSNLRTYTIQRNIKKSSVSSNLERYSYVNNYNSDIQNTYLNYSGDVLVASTSIPSYNGQPLSFYDRVFELNGSFSGDTLTIPNHGFYTGDSIYYSPGSIPVDIDNNQTIDYTITSNFDNLVAGKYFIKRINENQIKIAGSRSEINNNNFINISGIVTSNFIGPSDFQNLSVKPQNLLRLISEPNNESGVYETPVDTNIGIFINGVELSNYKSSDFIRYGEIEEIIVDKNGDNYDVINPPVIRIYDSVGTGATASVSVKGTLKKINIIDNGFDYVSEPIITIFGGNGAGAEAKVNTTLISHSSSFFSDNLSNYVDLTNNTIGFSTFHKFRSVEQVIYKTDGEKGISGLSTNSIYYVKSIDAYTIKLFKNENDAALGINTISLTSYGNGIHRIESVLPKKIISGISIINEGENYENKERSCASSGIVTSLNQINIKNHGYNSREIVVYSTTGTVASGLSTTEQYIVTKVDDDNFKLSHVGIASTNKYFYYENKQYVDITSTGTETHIFNYEPIRVLVSGKIGVATYSGQDFNAVLQPIFRGEINSADIKNGGIGYGSSEILNYVRQPYYELLTGKDAELIAVVNNSEIVDVIVNYSGEGYNSPPELLVEGKGNYADLTPVLSGGKIVSVKIVNGGQGYDSSTKITVIPSGRGADLSFKIKQWNVNLFQKYLNIISNDDGILKKSISDRYGLQYTHIYTPRNLRKSVYQKSRDNETRYGVYDLQQLNGQEISSKNHSPIIGWAYDGNPIYGPYGFNSSTGGNARLMKSGYKLVSGLNRPNFPLGFFVEDYEFDNSGDLDEHNGRYCVTPEYPNGVYAYFTTIDDSSIENTEPFSGYRKPVFPYVIGNTFKSKPIQFNFEKLSNQDDYDLSSDSLDKSKIWFRNTTSYNLRSENSFYDFITSQIKENTYSAKIVSTSQGQVDKVSVFDGGSGYKVNDRVIFDNSNTGGKSAAAIVSSIEGKDINTISVASTSLSNVELIPFDFKGKYVAYSESPHNLLNRDLISISGINTSTTNLQGNYNIGVTSSVYSLSNALGNTSTTGIVTYISLSGNLNGSSIRENDILKIENEKVKVLNIDLILSRVRILREVDGTTGSAHTASTLVEELPRKFTFITAPELNVKFDSDKQVYFNPSESVGLGTLSGVGIGSTIISSNIGVGISQIFIPTRSIYIPDHEFITGEPIIYSNNGGSSLVVYNGSTTFNLENSSVVYAANISDNLIGISTVRIGLGTTGTFVGVGSTNIGDKLLYFVGFGTGAYHSFKTSRQNSVRAEITRNSVTVSTASSHGLSNLDKVDLNVNPSLRKNIVIKYNDYNRRVVVNPKDFIASDVDIENNTIFIQNHNLKTGDKIIHTSSSPCGGLVNQKIYYIIRYTKDLIKLSNSKYGAETFNKEVVNITSTSFGTISPINPKIDIVRNNEIVFDLSDSSLASNFASKLYSSFDFKIFTDEEFTQEFYGNLSANTFNVSRNGLIGISTNASVTLKLDDSVPSKLFYKLIPINKNLSSLPKQELVIDQDVIDFNSINVKLSKYSGSYSVVGVSSTSFNYYISEIPEDTSYSVGNGSFKYTTTSKNAVGSISSIRVNYGGYGYKQLPGITTITTENGTGAILKPYGYGIGNAISTKMDTIGFDYTTDKTLRPSSNLPEVFDVSPFNRITYIGVSSIGNGYSLPPGLVLFDEYQNKVIDDIDLKFTLGKTSVDILKNADSVSENLKIIPINNSNGVKISSITFNSTTKDVSVGLNTGFSDVFPFSIGDKVLIENVSVGIGTSAKGYNSENYNYKLFTLTDVPAGNTGLGGNVGIVTFNMSELLSDGEVPGLYDPINSAGRIIAEKDFPIFDIKLKKSSFAKGETVYSGNKKGIVESFNEKTNIIKLSSQDEFTVGDIVRGIGTKTIGIIGEKYNFNSFIDTDSTSEEIIGWENEFGFLSSNLQRIHDNYYYQNFSYSLQSKVSYNEWNDIVSSLFHISGLVKFSDLQIESDKVISSDSGNIGISNFVDVISDIVSEVDLSCYKRYDSVFENKLNISEKVISSEIYFSNRVLTDYFESVGNRVLTIDDFSDSFNSNPRPTPYSIVDEFNIEQKVKKYFTYIRDKRFTSERQALFVSIIHNGSRAYINQYGRVETVRDLGSFDVSFRENFGNLLFYPTLFELNDYDLSYISLDIENTVAGIGETTLGDTVKISTQNYTIPTSSSGNIISIGTTYRASKILVQLDSTDGRSAVDEINLIHDGSNIEFLNYGQMIASGFDSFESIGLGSYYPYIAGSELKIDFIPYSGIGVTANSIIISIANTSSTGVGTYSFGQSDQNIAFINSSITSIASSSSPFENVIAVYPNDITSEEQHDASYFLICVEDTTNGRYQFSEAILIDDDSDVFLTEYGNIETVSGLGTVGAGAGTTYTSLYFTPNPNIDVQVRVFQMSLQLASATSSPSDLVIDLNNGKINVGSSNYTGTFADVKREFNLTHNGKNIFQRYFLGNNSDVVDTENNTILIPEHFYVTGEELTYTHSGGGSSQAIGIAATDFGVGIGTTDKLPSRVYAIKVNETQIKLARSAEDALKTNPISLDIVSVGIGTLHSFVGNTKNGRCLVAIDNVIQSPIVETSVITSLTKNVTLTDNVIQVSGITSFFGGDLIKINNEIMKITNVGFGTTNQILVRRPWMGTGLSTHPNSSVVTKVQGNYNIVNNSINFADAPIGKTPVGSPTNSPDERDWTGITTHSKFQGRTFLKSGIPNSTEETYSKNYVFDDISDRFDSTTKSFRLTSQKQNISGFSTNNSIILVNGVFQGPQGTLIPTQDYQLSENLGITSITFLGAGTSVSYDPKTATIPVGGIIVSVGSTGGFGYQPLVSAGGTAIVSVAGTISAISIGNSGSGYRSGIQTVVNVGVYTSSLGTPNIQFIGTAAVSNGNIVSVAITNPGAGYTSSNPPFVIFDSPLSYDNIPLVYSSSRPSGVGTGAKVSIVVGQGSSVIDFEITNFGYNYGSDQILTVETGGLAGIPTDPTKPFSEFHINVKSVISDSFAGWNIGQLEVLDKIENKFNGLRRNFTLSKDGSPVTIKSKKGSNIDVQATLLVFLNNILQVPGEGYTLSGGSVITFAEPPKPIVDGIEGTGDTCKILFYKGSGDVDVQLLDVIETVKVGDTLTIDDNDSLCSQSIQQDERLVTNVISADSVETNTYTGPGISDDINCIRTVTWCQQRSDKLVDGKIISKSRNLYEPLVNPVSYIIKDINETTDTIYVDTIRPLYNSINENTVQNITNKINIISQDNVSPAFATCAVSESGSVSSIIINDGGYGYTSQPQVVISNPVGLGTTQRATAYANVSNGSVDSIVVSFGGTGYSQSNPPFVLIEPPLSVVETDIVSSYQGDNGVIVGFGTTTISGADKFIFDLFIPIDSYLRDTSIVSSATTISSISVGDYFTVYNSNVGFASTSISSIDNDFNVISIGKSFVDNVYYVDSTEIVRRQVVSPGLGGTTGVGVTYVLRVFTPISGISTISFDSTNITMDSSTYTMDTTFSTTYSSFTGAISTTTSISFGEYSWGKVVLSNRPNPRTFNFYGNDGIIGITSSAVVSRVNPLRYNNYIQ